MGNYRFRLSDMIPNALLYKLKNLGKKSRINHNSGKSNHHQQPQPTSSFSTSQSQRKSYHFPRDHISPEPPRKSAKKRRSTSRRSSRSATPRLPSASASAACSCRVSTESVWTKPDSTPEDYPDSPLDSTSSSSSTQDSISPELVSRPVLSAFHELDVFETVSKTSLPPIITKPIANSDVSVAQSNQPCKNRGKSDEKLKNSNTTIREKKTCPVHRVSGNSPGLKLRTNSPRIATRRIHGRRSVSSSKSVVPESFAVVKSSKDPQRDFRESMVEMIVENNIRASKDLENLLACYLSMNSNEYHDLIIKVFKQIWFDIGNVRLK